ncbi:MAG: DUF6252 family protein [Bacteroidota bacterium]
MKKIFLFSILLLAFVSCQDDVSFNNPSFEGKKDGVLWRAVDARATIAANGSLTIEAYNRSEVLTLKTINKAPQTYPLGTGGGNLATYVFSEDNGTITYTSEDLEEYQNGEIVIQEYDAVNQTVTGTFKFNVKNIDPAASDDPTINYQYGKFYKVPVTNFTL